IMNTVILHEKLLNTHIAALERKQKEYRTLIASAKTFEEVVGIWPAAEAVRPAIEGTMTALSVLSEDLCAKIKADNAGADFAASKAA
ncbi:MAG: hypothetical protein AAGF45_11575, partial [Pseudomonadota bacterium]